MRIRVTWFVFGFILSNTLIAQSVRISDFSVIKVGDSDVLVRWIMTSGSTCRTLEVERTLDKINFKSVYLYPGVCGGSLEETAYTWVDNNPIKNQLLYYRVKLSEGEYTLLDSVMIEKIAINDEIVISPNPSSGVFMIELNSLIKQAIKWEVFSQSGAKVMSGNTYSDGLFEINLMNQHPGVYILKIVNDESVEKTAFLSVIN